MNKAIQKRIFFRNNLTMLTAAFLLLANTPVLAEELIKYFVQVKTGDKTEAGSYASHYVMFYGINKDGEGEWSKEMDLGSPSRNEEEPYKLENKDLGVPTHVSLDLSKGPYAGNGWYPEYVRIYRKTHKADRTQGFAEFIIEKWHEDDRVTYNRDFHTPAPLEFFTEGVSEPIPVKMVKVAYFDNSAPSDETIHKMTEKWVSVETVEISKETTEDIGAYAEAGYKSSVETGGVNAKAGVTYNNIVKDLRKEINTTSKTETLDHSFVANAETFTIKKDIFTIPYRGQAYADKNGKNRRIIRTLKEVLIPASGGAKWTIPKLRNGKVVMLSHAEFYKTFMDHMPSDEQKDLEENHIPKWQQAGWMSYADGTSVAYSPLPKTGLITEGKRTYWFLNGDGSRNWLNYTPSCAGSAIKVKRDVINRVPKRHGGKGGYTLQPDSNGQICQAPQGSNPRLYTDGAYFWLVNSDGSRNWLSGSISSTCRANATRTSDIARFPKRHKGANNGTYGITGVDKDRACSV